jgi:hypothetical protein
MSGSAHEGRSQTRRPSDVSVTVPHRTDDLRHRRCESHLRRHFCTAEVWRRRKRAVELKQLCGGVR